MSAATAGIAAAAAAYVAGWFVRRVAAGRVLDQPGPRSSHVEARTRLGGLAIVAGLIAGMAAGSPVAATAGALVGAAIAGAAGLAEDLWGVPVGARLVTHAVAGGAVAAWALTDPSAWAWVAVVFWVVGVVNVFNFMDGIDGIAGLELAVAGVAWMVAGAVEDVPAVATFGAVALGAGTGFLPHNFPRARMFMGDLGSYAAGTWLAAAAAVAIGLGVSPVTSVAPLTVFVVDATWTLLARASRGENVLRPHRKHLYQRLVRAGWSHPRTSLVVAGFSALAAAGGLVALADGAGAAAVGASLAAAAAAGYVALALRVAGPLSEPMRRP